MGRLANISGKQAVKAFERAGWQSIGQVGSHLGHVGCARRFIVTPSTGPHGKEVRGNQNHS